MCVKTKKNNSKCKEYAAVMSQGKDNNMTFTTSNLLSHLRVNHPVVYSVKLKTRRKVKMHRGRAGVFTALRQLALQGKYGFVSADAARKSRSF